MLLKLAWRNIWRNRRRSLITIASILFAVILSAFMEALQKGAWENMINNVVSYYYGYAQVHKKGYWEEQTIDKAFPYADSLRELDHIVPEIQTVVPRLESFALGAFGDRTRGVMVVGIDPSREQAMTDLQGKLEEGTYLSENDRAVLVGSGVADRLELILGDTLVLISRGFRGVNAAGKYPVKGIVNFGSPELSKQMVYLPLKEAQWFYGAEGRLTSLAFHLEEGDDLRPTLRALQQELDTSRYEIMDWKQMLPDLLEARALDSAGNYIVYFILYIIIAFGIYGTILMMTKEREYEFGILVAVGMRRLQLGASVYLEVLLLGLMGALVGILCSIPLVYYFHVNPLRFSGELAASMEKFGFEPIFPTTMEPRVFLLQALIVFIITTVLALYPIYKIGKLKTVEAMRR